MTLGFDINNRKGVRSLPTNLFLVFPDLKALKVSNCSVTSVNDKQLRGLSKLKYLNLERNEIEQISSDAFVDLVSLEFLYLSHNRIPFLGKQTFASLKALNKLSLSFNEMKFLNPKIFHGLENVENIELWNNEIESLDENIFESMVSLKIFSITHNKLETIPKNLFRNNLKLESVWFEDNRLTAIDGHMFDHLSSLNYVDLSHNVCLDKFYYANSFVTMRNDCKQNCSGIPEAFTNVVAVEVIKIVQPILQNLEKKNLDLQKQLDKKSEEIRHLKENVHKMAHETNQNIKLLENIIFLMNERLDSVNRTAHVQTVIFEIWSNFELYQTVNKVT